MRRRLAAILMSDVVGYSRLMAQDEAGTLARLQIMRRDLFDPRVAACGGRIVKLVGDGALIEFPSVVDAVTCAVQVQRAMAEHNETVPAHTALRLRIGINLGDVIVEDDDIYGDGVNVASRLEQLAEPGGICLSEEVAHHAAGKVAARFEDMGRHALKGVAEPLRVYRVAPGAGDAASSGTAAPETRRQEIRYCTGRDGTRIAYATVGHGPPLLKAANWMNHLEYDWDSPIWSHWFSDLAKDYWLVRYDERGNGLSDWEVEDISFDAFVDDLETVVAATGLDRFPLLGLSQGCPVSIAYAVRHPEKVSGLVLFGGYAAGWRTRGVAAEIARREALLQLTKVGWGQTNPAFRQVFTSLFLPGGTAKQMAWFNELERMTTSPENAVRLQEAMSVIDVRPFLGRLRVPCLVLHSRDDAVVPFAAGRELAKTIPGARFVALDSANHILLETEAAWPRFLAEVRAFLRELV